MRKLLLLLILMLPVWGEPPVRYVIFHRPGPHWRSDTDFRNQDGVQEHIQYFASIKKQGRLYAGGPFLDAAGGGMMITQLGETPESARQLAQEDPAVRSGLLLFEIRPWLLGMEREP